MSCDEKKRSFVTVSPPFQAEDNPYLVMLAEASRIVTLEDKMNSEIN